MPGFQHPIARGRAPFVCRRVNRQRNVLSGNPSRALNRPHQQLQRLLRAFEIRRKAALVAYAGGKPLLQQQRFQRAIAFRAHSHRAGKIVRAGRDEHEFLNIDIVIRVPPAVEHVHHRTGHFARHCAAEPAVNRHSRGVCRRRSDCNGRGEHRVCAEARFVLRSVQRDHRRVDRALIRRIHAGQRIRNLDVDRANGVQNILSAERFAPVAILMRLVTAGGCARRCIAIAGRAAFEHRFARDGRIPPRIENAPRAQGLDSHHCFFAPFFAHYAANAADFMQKTFPSRAFYGILTL